jgi:hypothetical protein
LRASVFCGGMIGLISFLPAQAADDQRIVPTVVLDLGLRGVGHLSFGERFEWQLVIEPPKEVRTGDGIRMEDIVVRSAAGATRHLLPEPASYGHAENGRSCSVQRVGTYALLRCMRDYVFDTSRGAPPLLLGTQFNDRSDAAPAWLLELPLPWWRLVGTAIKGTGLLFLEYGFTNYGRLIESSEHYRGPALLDLNTGKIALGRQGRAADSPIYDASAARDDEAIALSPERFVGEVLQSGRRVITVMTTFDRCVGAVCRGDAVPGVRTLQPLTYVFE